MNYRKHYYHLYQKLLEDTDVEIYFVKKHFGGLSIFKSKPCLVIIIQKGLTYRQKLIILAHETSHLFSIYNGKFIVNPCKDEKQVNRRAVKLLRDIYDI